MKILLSENRKLWYLTLSRLDKRGVRVVTNARRDAMDADGIARRAVPEADGQGVWS